MTQTTPDLLSPQPAPGIDGLTAYSVPRAGAPVDLRLDGNEGAVPPTGLLAALEDQGAELLRVYPDAAALTEKLAARLGVATEQVLVTAGADDALDRACRAVLAPGRQVILPEPGFEMTTRYTSLAGATSIRVPWPGSKFPTDEVIAAVTGRTAMIVVTTPNNPTGAVASASDLARLSAAAPRALLLVDLAYVEFADLDLTEAALALPGVVITRTLSKAWGLAGLRVGYAAGAAEAIGWLRVAGAPYPVAGPSLAVAEAVLESREQQMLAFTGRIRDERRALTTQLKEIGAQPLPSQANFVLAEVGDPLWLRDAMAGLGIAVRVFGDRDGLERHVRIACPGDAGALARLLAALRTVRRPQALLLDMDGVLADVSGSLRRCIEETAAHFGITVSDEEVRAAKAAGNANDDWALTWQLLRRRGVEVELAAVTREFEMRYQGTDETPGLYLRESLIPDRGLLERLAAQLPLAIVTGRPRRDALRFLRDQGIEELFTACVCREDAPVLKPDPAPVAAALAQLGVELAWLVGDTPDDIRAARGAGVLPLGIIAPGAPEVLELVLAGAARTLSNLSELEGLLP